MKCPECDIGEMIPTLKYEYHNIRNQSMICYEHECNSCGYKDWVVDEILIPYEDTKLKPLSKEEWKHKAESLPKLNIDVYKILEMIMKEKIK